MRLMVIQSADMLRCSLTKSVTYTNKSVAVAGLEI